MTGLKVVDTSALAALVFGEPEAEAIAARLQGARLVAPALIGYELANVCLIKCRRQPDQRDSLMAAYRLGTRLPIDLMAVDHADVLTLADTTGLTAYDASYLWLARSLGADLVTLDRRLALAATGA